MYMEIISVANQKGGCGKTTTAVNLAYALSLNGFRVILIDFDPQAHASFSLGINTDFSIADLFGKIFNNEPVDIQNFLVSRNQNLWVLPSNMELSVIEHFEGEKKEKLEILSKLLAPKHLSFDYCIIDCPPNLGFLTLNALLCSHYAIAPIGICELSLQGVMNLIDILRMSSEHTTNSCKLLNLITQFDKRFKFSQQFLQKTREQCKDHLLTTIIRTNIHLREATALGKSIYEFRKDSRGAQDYLQLAEEIIKVTGAEAHQPLDTGLSNRKILNRISDNTKVNLRFKSRDFNEVFVVGEFNNWRADSNSKLNKLDVDTWAIDLALEKGTYRYKFIADGNWINDPANPTEEKDPFGGINSILSV